MSDDREAIEATLECKWASCPEHPTTQWCLTHRTHACALFPAEVDKSVEPSQEATFSRVAERVRQIADNLGSGDVPATQNALYGIADSFERILKDASDYADKQQREIERCHALLDLAGITWRDV